jgi:capsular polysaccharide export protein
MHIEPAQIQKSLTGSQSAVGGQVFLMLQGPICPFFPELADALEARGHRVLHVNLCFGDWLFWRRRGGLNYRGTPEGWPAFLTALMDREGVTDLLLLGEHRFYHKVAILAAQPRGIAVTVTDFGYLRPDWVTIERDGMSAHSHLPRDPAAIMALARDLPAPDLERHYQDSFSKQATWDVIYHIGSMLGFALYPFYRTHQIYNPVLNYLGTGWRLLRRGARGRHAEATIAAVRACGQPYWVLPMQMEVDFSIRAYSRYPDMLTPIREVIESFARCAPTDGRLVIKVHPLDPGLRRWSRLIARAAETNGIADRVDFIDGGVLETLLEGSQGIVTVNSTVGLWAMRAGVPVLTLGEAVYNVHGLVFEGQLDHFWSGATPPNSELLDAFLRCMADTVMVRGVYYLPEGRAAAVAATAARLERDAQASIAARFAEAIATGKAQSARPSAKPLQITPSVPAPGALPQPVAVNAPTRA